MSDEIKETIRILSHEEADKMLYEQGGTLSTPAGDVHVEVHHLETMPPRIRHGWRFHGQAGVWPVAPVANGRDLTEAVHEAVTAHVNNTGRGAWRAPSETQLRRELDEAVRLIGVRTEERDEARGLLAQNEAAMDKLLAERDDFRRHIDEIADVLGDETEWSNCNDRGARALELANESDAALRDARGRLDQAAQLLGERTAELAEVRKELEARRAADGMVGERNVALESQLKEQDEAFDRLIERIAKTLGVAEDEETFNAAERVVAERDTALRDFESERKRAIVAIDYDATVREALGAVPAESTLSAARRLEAERDRALESLMASASRRESELQDLLDAIRSRLAAGDHETAVDAVDRVLHSHGVALEEAKTALRDQIEASGKTVGRLGGQLAEAEGQVTRIAEEVNADADELAIEAVQRVVSELTHERDRARSAWEGQGGGIARAATAELAIERLKADHKEVTRRLEAKLRAAVSGSDLAASVAPSIEALADAVLSRLAGEIERLGQRAAQLALTIDRLRAERDERAKALRNLQESTAVPMQEIFDVRAALDAAGPWNKAAVTPAKRVTMLIKERDERQAGHVKLHEELHNLQVAATARAQNAAVLQSKLEGRESRISELEQIIDANAAGAEARAAKLEAEVVTAIRQRDGLDADLSAEQRLREQAEEKVTALTKGLGRAQSDKDKTEKRLAELGRRYDDLVSRIGAALASAAMVGRDVVVSKGGDRG